MPEYSVAAYTIKIRSRHAPSTSSNFHSLSNFDDSGTDLLPFLHGFSVAAAEQAIRHKSEEKYLQVRAVRPESRLLHVELESGSHGFSSRFVDVERNAETYQRRTSDAELLPIRNIFAVPLGAPTGLLITERIGIRGAKSTLAVALQQSFSHSHPSFTLDILPIAPEQAVKKSLEKGEVKGIKLVRYGIPEDLADRYNLGKHEDEIGTIEVSLKPRRSLSFAKKAVEDMLESGDKAGLLEWRGVEYHDIKVEVKVGRQTRTLTVTKKKDPRVTFPFPEGAEVDESGRPTDEEFATYAKSVVKDLCRDIGLNGDSLIATGPAWTEDMLNVIVEVSDIES